MCYQFFFVARIPPKKNTWAQGRLLMQSATLHGGARDFQMFEQSSRLASQRECGSILQCLDGSSLHPGMCLFFSGGGEEKRKSWLSCMDCYMCFVLKKRPFIYLDIQSISSCILHRLMRCDFNMTRDSRSWHIVLNTTISAAWLWPQFNWLNSLDLPKQQVVQRLLGHGMFRAVGDVGRRPRVVNRNSKCPLNMPFHQVGEGSPEYT